MNWLSYLYPQTVLKTSSNYNRNIRINEENGKFKLLVDGARESGEYIRELWEYAFRELRFPWKQNIRSILVLGVAGGTVIHMLRKAFPEASITGVEIDEVMIDIGKQYFGLGSFRNLRLICDDAVRYVQKSKKGMFDLVILDIFIGPDVPDVVLTEDFQKDLRGLLRKNGVLLVNYLRQPGYETKVPRLHALLRRLYKEVSSADQFNNRFFMAT